MRNLSVTGFPGPNIWFGHSCTSGILTCNPLSVHDTAASLLKAMRQALQSCPAPFASLGSLPLLDSTAHNHGEIVGQLTIDLQRHTGIDVRRYHCTDAASGDRFHIVVECEQSLVGRLAMETAVRLVEQWPLDPPGDQWLRDTVFRLSSLIRSTTPDGTAAAIVRAARQRHIPVGILDPQGARIELGNGKWRRRIWGSQTSHTSTIGESLALHKPTANAYLRNAGLPVPEGRVVRTIDDALEAANNIGYPIVIKPIDSGNSTGVFVGLQNDAELIRYFSDAISATNSELALVEKFVPGRQFRIVVVDGRIISVSEYTIASVTGDGRSSIRELIDIANLDPRRGLLDSDPMEPIDVDAMTLRILDRQGLSIHDIPAAGQDILLKQAGRIPNGGMSIDRTEDIHPDNAQIACQAVKVIDLDVAAIDIIAEDIAESIWNTQGAIVDVNTNFHTYFQEYPAIGEGRDPGPSIVDMLFPPGTPVRVPIIAVVGDGAGQVCEEIALQLGANGLSVGLATESRISVEAMELRGVKRTGVRGIQTILNNPSVEIAVTEVTAQGIIDEGLGFGYCDAAVILSTSGQSTPFGRPVESVLTQLIGPAGYILFDPADVVAYDLVLSSPAIAIPFEPGTTGWLDDLLESLAPRD